MKDLKDIQISENEVNRFIEDGSGSEILHRPQCVNCTNNTGMNGCDAFGTKPEEYISNYEDCPMRKADDNEL